MTDPYATLGIPKDADAEQIKRAYREASRKHHPDHGGDPAEFRAAKAAYDLLSDPEKRAAFDRGEPVEPGLGEWFRQFFAGGGSANDATATLAAELEKTRDAAEDACALVDLVRAVGAGGIDALTITEDDDPEDAALKAGLLVLLDVASGGDGRSVLQEEEPKRRRGKRVKA
jgi:curved DNA-binding protein CbpA